MLQQEKMMSDLIGQSGVFKAKEENVKRNVVICTAVCKMQGQEHRSNLQNDGHSSDLILCKDKDLFTEEALPFNVHSAMYILVDEVLISVLLNKRRAVETVELYFEGFAEAGNRVFLINNLDDDHKFKTLFYQLPQGCAKIYTEIVISQSPKNRASSPVMQEEEEEEKTMAEEEEEEEKTMAEEEEEEEKTMAEEEEEEEKTMAEEEEEEEKTMAEEEEEEEKTMAEEGEEWIKEEEDSSVDNVAKTDSMLDLDADGTSEQKGKPAEGNNDIQCLQVGSHCKMTISAQSNQLVIAKQDGSHNIVNISVEPSPSSSKMVVVMTSNPDNPDLEGLLVQEIDRDTDVLNISLTSLEAAIVGVRKGSVVMEIEVKSGQNMNPDWMTQVLQTILKDILTPDVLGETKLQVDINTLNVIPKEKLGDYVLLRDPERQHETCVQREKYQALQNRLEATQNKMKESENDRVVEFVNHTHSSGVTILLVSGPPVHLQDKLLAQF